MDNHTYQICIKGHLDERWFRWFTDLTVTPTLEQDTVITVITGQALDQAALHAILNRIRDLGLELIFVRQVEP